MFKRCLAALILASWSLAQVPGFDPSLDWQTQTTPHFDLHYPSTLAALAPQVAAQAEADYQKLQARFPEDPGRIQLVLTYGIASPNGFANPALNQVVLYTAQQRQADSFNVAGPKWWETLVLHELVHAFDLSRGRASPGGSDLPVNAIKPPPFIEGFAVYQKQQLLGASRVNTARTRMLLRTMVANSSYPTLNEVMSYYQKENWPSEGLLAYNFGAWWMKYLADTYGQDTLINFIAVTDLGLPKFDQAFREHFGVSLAQSYQDFLAYLEAEFTPELAELAPGATKAERVTSSGHFTAGPTLSSDDLAYVQATPRQSGLRLRSDGQDRELVSGAGIAFPSWAPTGQKLLYSRIEPYGPYQNGYDLFELDLLSGETTKLITGENSYMARYTQAGDIAYLRQNLDGSGGVYLSSDGQTQPIWTPAIGSFHALAPSPDGRYIAITYREGAWQDLYLISADGTRTRLTQDPAAETDLAWSSDGQYLIFAREEAVSDLYAYRPADGQFFRITRMMTGAFQPAGVSPQAGLVFLSYGPEGFDLYRIPYQPQDWSPVELPVQPEPSFAANELFSTSEPYQVRDYLAPWFWLPGFISSSAAGFLAAGGDPLYRHAYGVGVGWAWDIGSPTLSLNYTYQGLPGLPLAFSALADQTGIDLNLLARRPLAIDESTNREPQAGLGAELKASQAEHWRAYLGESRSHRASQEARAQRLTWGYRAGLGGAESETGVLGEAWLNQSWSLATATPSSVMARIKLGASSAPLFSLGGVNAAYPLRGFATDSWTGTTVSAASLGYRFRLASLEQPLLGLPVFLDKLDAEVFFDSGSSENSVKGSLGAEMGLSFTLGYLLEGPRLVAGIAQGLGEPEPIAYWRLELAGLSF